MNERINELAGQADNYAYKMNPEEDSYGRPANPRKFQQDRDTKFSELIVKKCMDVAKYHTPDTEECEYTWLIHDKIKEHFGVEE